MAVDAHNGGVEPQKWSHGGSVDPWMQIRITLKSDPDPHKSEKPDPDPHKSLKMDLGPYESEMRGGKGKRGPVLYFNLI